MHTYKQKYFFLHLVRLQLYIDTEKYLLRNTLIQKFKFVAGNVTKKIIRKKKYL